MSDKTEEATPKRLKKARGEGDSPVSAALSQSVGFMAALSVVGGVVTLATEQTSALLSLALRHPTEPASPTTIARIVLTISLPVVALAAAASSAASFVQTGANVSAKKLIPSLDRLNPFTGLKNLFSWQRVVGIA